MDSGTDGQIGKRTAAAAIWLVSVRLLTKSIDFIALLVLARLLTPADFGLVAIAMTLIFIVEAVLELPINQALVRQSAITQSQLDTAFTLAVLRGLILAALLALAAYPFSFVYGDHRLVGLVLALGWAPVLRGLMSPKLAVYARQIDFRRDFIIDLSGKVVSLAFSIVLAWQTHSYWALVLGTVVTPLVMMITSYLVAPYRPRLSLRDWPIFAGFAGWSTVTQMLSALSWQADRLILGRFATRQQLGTFTLANDLSYIPELALIKPIMRPLMSAFAHVGDSPERLRHAYERASVALLAVGSPVMLGLCLLADPVVRLMLGGKWLPAIPILQILPLSLIPPLLSAPFWSLAMAAGRPRLYTWQTLVDLVVRSALLLVGAITAGVSGVIVGRILASLLSAISAAWCVRSITGASVFRQFGAAWRVALAGAALSGGIYLVRPLAEGRAGIALALVVALAAAVGGLLYLATLFASWRLAGAPVGVESWCIDRVRQRVGPRLGRYLGPARNQPSPAFGYLLLTGERWRAWHQSGELVPLADGTMDQGLLMSAAQILVAMGGMTGRLHAAVLVQVDVAAVSPLLSEQPPRALPLSSVRRFFYLRDLTAAVMNHADETKVVPLRRHQA
ncbi:lipopolysaccharide biosynthesis protein [Sphingomonas sp. GC_Shp_1]|uniref:lipopolysaccharide biosynthesis protein n=3 Tax=unclassified Sphingomonas TaxID=196159 RepID=UPI00226B0281